MSDLVEGLRSLAKTMSKFGDQNHHGVSASADEIERLRAGLKVIAEGKIELVNDNAATMIGMQAQVAQMTLAGDSLPDWVDHSEEADR